MMRSFISVIVSMVCVAAANLRAADAPPAENLSPAEQYRAVANELSTASKELAKELESAKDEKDRKALYDKYGDRITINKYAPKFLNIIRTAPQDPAAIDAFIWITSRFPDHPETQEGAKLIEQNWIESDKLEKVCKAMQRVVGRPGRQLLQAAIDKNPHHSVQGYARFSLALALLRDADREANTNRAAREKAERLLQEIVADYGDLESYPTTLGKAAEKELSMSRSFTVGSTVPEVEGVDLDGRPMKLSEFRGKVVLVVFWATWCGPCMSDVPEERKLVDKLAGKPFVLVGVNGDEDTAKATEIGGEKGVNWRSFRDGGQRGPIAEQWNVSGWPSLFLIDSQGVLVARGDTLRASSVRQDKDGKFVQFHVVDDLTEKLVEKTTSGQ